MKRLFLAFVCCMLFLPVKAMAFVEAPLAVVVLDHSGSGADREFTSAWSELVRQRFRFPDYKLMEQVEVLRLLHGKLPVPEKKSYHYNKEALQNIAETVGAELVFVIWVDSLDEREVRSFRFSDETFLRVEVSADVMAYRRADDKYLTRKVRYFKTEYLGSSSRAAEVAYRGVSDAVDAFKEAMPRIQQ